MLDIGVRREKIEFDEAKTRGIGDMRSIIAKDLYDALENQLKSRTKKNDVQLGKVFFADPRLKGTRKWYQRAYANAMTIFQEVGPPSL